MRVFTGPRTGTRTPWITKQRLFVLLALGVRLHAAPASAHEAPTCATMAKGSATMQNEIDDLRRRVRSYELDLRARRRAEIAHTLSVQEKRAADKAIAAEDAQRALLKQRADIEQQKVVAWRHNLTRCVNQRIDSH